MCPQVQSQAVTAEHEQHAAPHILTSGNICIAVQHLRQVCERPSIVTAYAVCELHSWQSKHLV